MASPKGDSLGYQDFLFWVSALTPRVDTKRTCTCNIFPGAFANIADESQAVSKEVLLVQSSVVEDGLCVVQMSSQCFEQIEEQIANGIHRCLLIFFILQK